MLVRNLCQALYWESNIHRTCWALAKTANQSSCGKTNKPVQPPKTGTQSYRAYSTVRARLAHSVAPQQYLHSPTLSSIHGTHCHMVNRTWTNAAIFHQSQEFLNKFAVVCPKGRYTYKDVLHYSADLASEICRAAKLNNLVRDNNDDQLPLKGETIAFLCGNDMSYVVTLLAIWMCGGIAVPLCTSHPVSELEYFILDSGAKIIISSAKYESHLSAIASQHELVHKVIQTDDYSGDYEERSGSLVNKLGLYAGGGETFRDTDALIVYTSGTTGRPKGAVHTFGSIAAQVRGMVGAWGWTHKDVVLHVLPLHHVHGIVNVLLTPLYCGATCVMMTKFDPLETWQALLNMKTEPRVNVFMAVPTIYARLIEFYKKDQETGGRKQLPNNVRFILENKIRLMVSGSSALPQPIMKKWEQLTGHTLLERYGMTEIGMALTNALEGNRIPGAVGKPFPGVSVKIAEFQEDNPDYVTIATADTNNSAITSGKEGNSGELLVKGDNVFKEYWRRPKATSDSFTKDGWFKTGDTAVCEDGVFKIVGRTSVDIIKSGAYKISALDIERHLLEHPDVKDVAVVGLPDETWGQMIAVVVVPEDGAKVDFDHVKAWAREKMPPYQVPRIFKSLKEMPRNAMGKVNKKDLAASVFPEYLS